MTLLRLLIIAAVIWLLIRLIRQALGNRGKHTPGPAELPGKMVRCEHCGLHLPVDEAIVENGRTFCSRAQDSVRVTSPQ